jgi:K+-transporting ATPase KdpF subunit
MDFDTILSGLVACVVFVYLLYALIRPDSF